jgi:TfoX/Sxy family transcriptional regulator of competence genes
MASDIDFVNYVVDQIKDFSAVTYRKMFGEYLVYVNQKPAILICDNTAFIKMLDGVKPYFENGETGFPYKGAKRHYILDIDNKETLPEIIKKVLEETKPPKKKSAAKTKKAR